MADAAIAEGYDGWLYLSGYGKDGFSSSIADLREWCADNACEVPPFAFACDSEPPQTVDYDDLVENAFCDSFEDAHEHVGAAEEKTFRDAIDAFNEHIAKILSWTPDFKRKVSIL